jgi:hypothetical protein
MYFNWISEKKLSILLFQLKFDKKIIKVIIKSLKATNKLTLILLIIQNEKYRKLLSQSMNT